MRRTGICAAVIGFAAVVVLMAQAGFADVLAASVAIGPGGLGAMILARLPPLAACAAAWRIITPPRRAAPALFLWFRLLRDGANELVGVLPCVGEIVAVRAMMLTGQATPAATASLVADLTIELSAQIAFTLIGAALMLHFLRDITAAACVFGGMAGSAALVAAVAAVQRLGISKVLRRLGRRIVPESLVPATVGLDRALAAIYRDRRRVARAAAIHLLAWALGGVETWIGCRLLGARIGFEAALILECAVFALRSAAFVVPSGIGVQEGGYAFIGAFMGLPLHTALALSLVRRGRDLVLAIPTVLAWEGLEIRHRRRSGLAPRARGRRDYSIASGAETNILVRN